MYSCFCEIADYSSGRCAEDTTGEFRKTRCPFSFVLLFGGVLHVYVRHLMRHHARQLRLKHARLPEILVIETYPFERQPKLNKKRIMALYDSLSYMHQHQNVIWLGISGCGKTGLATAFLIHAIDQGYRGRYVLFGDLINELYAAVADHSENKVLKKYLAFDIILIDEIGYAEVEPVQVGLFFTLMHERHKKKPTFITSNLGFAEWGSFLKNDHLTNALVDRLTENSHVINMKGCKSLRSPLEAEPCAES